MGSRTTPAHVQAVPGCPRSVAIYRIPASSVWQFRFFEQGRYVRRTTGEAERGKALVRAKELYKEILLGDRQNTTRRSDVFAAVAKDFLHWQGVQIRLGRLSSRTQREDINKLKRDVLPFFGTMPIQNIKKATLDGYLSTLAERRLSKSTLNKHIGLIRKILRYAVENDLLATPPRFPTIGSEANARPYFDLKSYKLLNKTAIEYAKTRREAVYRINGRPVRTLKFTPDFADFIEFHVNVFIRLSDIKELRHKHIKVVKGAKTGTYLEIFPPHSKTSDRSSVSMKRAVEVYERLAKRHRANGFGLPDDFVFYPEHVNRTYAMDVIRRLFWHVLDETDLRHDERGKVRTLYSLRHTALMLRIVYGDKIDPLFFAQNALTSVEMLEKFYLSHAQGTLRVEELQSFKSRVRYSLKPGLEKLTGYEVFKLILAEGSSKEDGW